MNAASGGEAEAGLWTPRILLSFLALALIWGSTWIVIKDQITSVPPLWSVSYRFLVASLAMFLIVRLRGRPLLLDRNGQFWAIILGLAQFSFNFNFVYAAEGYITSGLVAVLFALLMVPNAILGRLLLGQRISGGFLFGSAVAIAGIALLFVQEYRAADVTGATVAIGIALTVGGILSASAANIIQATDGPKAHPISTLIAWSMVWGMVFNGLLAFGVSGPPVVEPRAGYFAGILYLGVVGSAVTFPLYFGMIREIGAAQAAYTAVLVPVVAMAWSTLLEGYVWSPLAAAGAVLALVGLVLAMRARRPRVLRIQA